MIKARPLCPPLSRSLIDLVCHWIAVFQESRITSQMTTPESLTCLQLVGEARVKQLLRAELRLVNSLPDLLKDCSFTIEGVGLTDGKPVTHE